MAKLIVYNGDQVVREIPLVKEPFYIGRALESDLAVMDHLVSRRHAKLERDPAAEGCWRVSDLGSSNGVYVNEQKIVGEKHLFDGDICRIGSATIHFKDDVSREARSSRRMSIAFTPQEEPGGLSFMKSVAELRADYTRTTSGAAGVSMFREKAAGGSGVAPAKAAKEGLHFFILYQLAGAINSATSLDELFERSLDMLVEALDAGVGAILLIDKATGELIPKASKDRRGRGTPGTGELKLSKSIVNKVIQDKVAFLTRDALVDSRFAAGKSVAAMQIRSAICVPIWDAGEVDGVLYIDNSSRPGAFGEEDQKLVVAVGNQLAVAIKREEMLEKLKAEAVIRNNLERYHSPDVVEMILKHGGTLGLDDIREMDVTVLFSDIEGFTKMSERLPPAEVAKILNAYFEGATDAIFRNQGQVNKYIGDAILAVFGAPIANPDHAANACRAALEMLEALRRFRATLPQTEQFRMRIGMNSGPVVAGNIGASKRMEYTVIGNTVNIASRLEKIAPPDGIAIGPDTVARIQGKGFLTESMGPIRLKGIASDMDIHRLLGIVGQPPIGSAGPGALPGGASVAGGVGSIGGNVPGYGSVGGSVPGYGSGSGGMPGVGGPPPGAPSRG
jgi:adenylate cyclase